MDDFFQLACIDNTGQFLVVAGQHGFVHFSLLTRKWKLFGNAGQVTTESFQLFVKDEKCCFN